MAPSELPENPKMNVKITKKNKFVCRVGLDPNDGKGLHYKVYKELAESEKMPRTNGWTVGWTRVQSDRWTVGRTASRTVGRTNGRTGGRMIGRTASRTVGRTDGRTDE